MRVTLASPIFVLNTLTFYLELDDQNEVNFNEETLTFT